MAKKRSPTRPGPDEAELRRSVQQIRATARGFDGMIFRAVATRFASREDLWTGAGARRNGGRWNPPNQFHTVYASADVPTAVAEYFGNYSLFGLEAAVDKTPFVTASAHVRMRSILDLTTSAVPDELGLTAESLIASGWQAEQDAGAEPLTQIIGRVAYATGIEGLIVPSAARAGGTNVVVFFWNLSPPDSFLSPVNPDRLPSTT